MEERSMPGLGERFPEMTVKTTHGMKKLPDDFAGKWFVLFSHPGDFTPVCTTEFVAFQKRIEKFKDMKCEISFPIIADSLGDVAKKLGMIHSGKGSNSVRAVFIVDAEGLVRIMLYYPQEIGRNMDEIVRAVRALQTADKHRVAIPANWPENEIIGDKVIVPPAADVQSIKDRLAKDKSGEIECLDWWLCYKSL
jgi:peroxiredoxin (alkyl hydroperoxide reductase subunit C)